MRKIINCVIGMITITLICAISCNFSSGSYPNAEIYEFKINESEIISIIERFKKNNPDYCVPEQTQLKDGKSDDRNDHWYHIYFYYKDKNWIIYTWVRQTSKDMTSFAFVSINEGLNLGNWKDINKDYSSKENKLQKELFEQRILNEIKKQIK
ncbi:MAG: hypothetical protein HXX16_04535 [Bacteroidales bacterium]|nr:hypothetical protein [Bacteroidales bacterium]